MSKSSLPITFAPSTQGLTLALHDFGGSGRPVLAAHATGFNGLVWQPLATQLTDVHSVAVDFRAHGGSKLAPGADLNWNRFADDVLASLDALGWANAATRPTGIGHSMGGAALLLAELRCPGTFAGLWIFEPITFPPSVREMMAGAENPLAKGALRRRSTFDSREQAHATYASKPPMNAFNHDALAGYVEGGFIDEQAGTVRLACEPENESSIYTLASTCDAFERLHQVTCPVLVVRGKRDEFGPSAIAQEIAAALPHGRLITHDELSHFGPMENPVGLAHEIRDFISSFDVDS